MKNTALTDVHISLGAKMVPFAGYNMPVQYEGVNIEHETVRQKVGVFDVSHMGEFLITGPNALDLIQKVTSNDASKLYDGRAQYSCLPNDNLGIVDDLIVYKIADEKYLMVVNASNIEKDWNWISKQNTMGAEMRNLSDDYSLLAIQGPKAIEAMQALTPINLSTIKFYHFEAGEDFGIKPIGLAARDTLRLEMGYCLYGNDINDSTSPLEAGLGWVTKFTKDFVGSDKLKKQKEEGIKRKLVGFELVDRGVPRHDYPIVNAAGNEIGVVTSGTMGPSVKKAIGLGYVPVEYADEGNDIYIKVRNKQLKAKVTKPPFYKG